MFEQITDKRLKDAVEVVNNLSDYSSETIISSGLNDFTKSFIINDGVKFSNKEELIKIIEKSIKLNLNYCLRPTWTITNYIFGSYDSKQNSEIIKKTDIFTYYSFYTSSIKEVASDEHYLSIKRSLVEDILRQINSDIYNKLTTDTTSLKIKNFFLQVFKLKYGDAAEISLDMSVPYSFIRLFLEDKSYNDLTDKFNKAGISNDDEEIELKTIIKVLTGKINNINEVYKPETLPPVSKQEEPPQQIKDTVIFVPEKPAEDMKPESFVKTEPVSTFSDTSTNEDTSDVQSISNEFVEKEEIPEKHLRFHFKDDEIKAIAKKVYKGNKYVLLDSLLEIEKLKNWREATEYLKEIFINNKVSIGDKSVIMFVDVLNDYFEKR